MRRLLPLALVVAVMTVACSTSVDEAEEAYCDSVETWSDALSDVRALTPTSTVEESQAAIGAMESAYDDVVSAAGDYADAQLSEIDAARAEFESTIDSIPDSATLAEADQARDEAFETLLNTVRATLNTQCS